jgi:hypothetical protein
LALPETSRRTPCPIQNRTYCILLISGPRAGRVPWNLPNVLKIGPTTSCLSSGQRADGVLWELRHRRPGVCAPAVCAAQASRLHSQAQGRAAGGHREAWRGVWLQHGACTQTDRQTDRQTVEKHGEVRGCNMEHVYRQTDMPKHPHSYGLRVVSGTEGSLGENPPGEKLTNRLHGRSSGVAISLGCYALLAPERVCNTTA